MERSVDARFDVESWEETAVDQAVPKVTRATVTARYSGGIEGSSVVFIPD